MGGEERLLEDSGVVLRLGCEEVVQMLVLALVKGFEQGENLFWAGWFLALRLRTRQKTPSKHQNHLEREQIEVVNTEKQFLQIFRR